MTERPATTPTPAPPVPKLPASSRYILLRCIASGGMGSIYYGIQRGAAGFTRPVAIKRAHPHLLDAPEVREGILAEARNGSGVRHPNVVSIDDVEEIGGELLLVMDYVEGCAFSKLINGSSPELRLPHGVALRMMIDVCLGLQAIHEARDLEGRSLGLVHRDISPHNVLVSLDGVARITDFGIAKSIRDRRHTAPTMRRGKFGYMAPEYIKSRASTARSDLFAVGVLLWEALAGRRLFEGRSELESIELTRAAIVPSLRAIDATISAELEGVVKKALARTPEERYGSARELGDALERAARGLVAPRSVVAKHVADVRAGASNGGSLPAGVPVETLASSDLVVETATMDVVSGELEIVPAPKPGKIFQPPISRRSKAPRRIAA